MKKIVGLTSTEVELSREKHGANVLKKEKRVGFLRRFLENLGDPIIKILLIAVAAEILLSFGQCNYFEVGGILVAVLIATVVSTVFEYGSEAAFEKLEAESVNATADVIRNGKRVSLPSRELVVGDAVLIKAGEVVEADGYLLSGAVCVNQSALNGEGVEVCKRATRFNGRWELDNECAVFRGSTVSEGDAVMWIHKK